MSTNDTPLITLIHTKWEEANRERDANGFAGDIFTETPKVTEARELEQLLQDRFESSMEQYNDGLISASEFLTRLNQLAAIPVGEGE